VRTDLTVTIEGLLWLTVKQMNAVVVRCQFVRVHGTAREPAGRTFMKCDIYEFYEKFFIDFSFYFDRRGLVTVLHGGLCSFLLISR
jgi:hypothetical protein